MRCKSRLIKVLCIGIFLLLKFIITQSNTYFTPEPDHADTSCLFINTAPPNITDYIWNFGDGEIIHDTLKISPEHKYASPGLYSVCIIVADSSEPVPFIDTICQLIEILDVNAECFADFSYTFINDYKIHLTDNSPGMNKKVLWEFGDGKYSNINNSVVHAFDEAGYYDVKLSILDDSLNTQCQTTKTIIIAAEDITMDAYFTDSLNSFDKNRVYFINLSPGSMNYLWDLDDGTISQEENPAHYYQSPGIYNVTLTVYDTLTGYMDNYSKPVSVDLTQYEMKSRFDYFPDIENSTVYFQDISTGEGIENYLWDFGDGDTAIERNPVHQYTENGIYDVCLSTWGHNKSYYNTSCETVFLIDSLDSFADFNFYLDSLGTAVFNNLSRGHDLIYTWDFGDSTFSSETNPVHTYADTGIYVIHLTAADISDSFHKFRILNFRSEQKSLIGGIGIITGDETLKSSDIKKLKPKGIISGDISKFAWRFNNFLINTTSLSPVALDINVPYNEICLELFNMPGNKQCMLCKNIYFSSLDIRNSKLDEGRMIEVYPNPSRDYINVEYILDNYDNGNIEIYELTGRRIKNIPVHSAPAVKTNLKISSDNFANGIYYLRFVTGQKSEVLKISVLK